MENHGHETPGHEAHGHVHSTAHFTEADWAAMVGDTERYGEAFDEFTVGAIASIAALRADGAAPVRPVVDIGSGPGVATTTFARAFPGARVTAVDASPAMLARAKERAAEHGVGDRVDTLLAELPGGLSGLAPADVIWASASLHHVGDEIAALRAMRDLLSSSGLLVIAELAAMSRSLPVDVDFADEGFAERFDAAGKRWWADMRAGLPGSTASRPLDEMVEAAGLSIVESRVATLRFDAPLTDAQQAIGLGELRRTRHQLSGYLKPRDLAVLDALADIDNPRYMLRRPDVHITQARHIVIACRREGLS